MTVLADKIPGLKEPKKRYSPKSVPGCSERVAIAEQTTYIRSFASYPLKILPSLSAIITAAKNALRFNAEIHCYLDQIGCRRIVSLTAIAKIMDPVKRRPSHFSSGST
jgi:hypothetical protein